MSDKTPTKDKPFFKSGYDLFSDKNPKDSIRIKYSTITETKNTIRMLERLYKRKLYNHTRIVQVANIIVQRLRVIKKNNKKGNINEINKRLDLAEKYFSFLKGRSKVKDKLRYKLVFTI